MNKSFHPFRKKWGQNFLRDPNTITKIINCLEPCASDTILEIGPGDGALTSHLSNLANQIHVVEIDPLLVKHLLEKDFPKSTRSMQQLIENCEHRKALEKEKILELMKDFRSSGQQHKFCSIFQ